MNENKTFFFGEYVLSGLPNAFNQKTSYWLTKKGNDCRYVLFYSYGRLAISIGTYFDIY